MEDQRTIGIIAAAILILGYFGLAWSGFFNVSTADMNRMMRQEGIQNTSLGDYGFFECGKGDIFSRKFTGTKNGIAVRGVVCSGLLKDMTVRYR
jgi:hypothetical protein